VDQAEIEKTAEGLTELERKILAHIYAYGPDTPWLMARRLLGAAGWTPVAPEGEVEEACRGWRKWVCWRGTGVASRASSLRQ
jgi:hypothetical protein